LSIEETGIRFRPLAVHTGEIQIDIQRVMAVDACVSEQWGFSRASPGLAVRLPEQVLLFALAPDACILPAGASASGPDASISRLDASTSRPDASRHIEPIVAQIRGLMAAQFAHADEVRVSLFRGPRRQDPHAVLAVSD